MGRDTLTKERVDALLQYEKSTGDLIWRVNRSRSAKAGDVAGNLNLRGYLEVRVDGALYRAHRLVWLIHYGCWPLAGLDHINRVKTDNRVENLREAPQRLNTQNSKRSVKNSSGFKGVRWYAKTRSWEARITKGGKDIHLGYFKSITEAIAARETAERELFDFSPLHQITTTSSTPSRASSEPNNE